MFFRDYWWLVVPALAFLAIFFFVPVSIVFLSTVWQNNALSFALYQQFFGDGFYLNVLSRTLMIGAVVTAAAILIGYPLAFWIYRAPGRRRQLMLSLVVFPLLTNSVVRSFSWMVMLGRQGFVNSMLQSLNIVDQPARLLFTPGAVIVGLIHLFLPLMVLSLVSAMENISDSVLEAASSLGANEWTVFRTVIFPLTFPGLIIGSTLVFTGAITAYVTPQMLGGSRVLMLATLLRQQAMVLFNWDMAAVIAAVSTGLTVMVIASLNLLQKRRV